MHPVTTEEVIQVVEETDLTADLGRFVLHCACLDAPWLRRVMIDRALTLNVNVSGIELVAPDYVARVGEILRATGWPALPTGARGDRKRARCAQPRRDRSTAQESRMRIKPRSDLRRPAGQSGHRRSLESSYLYIILTMALSIKHPEADRLARELAARTGETLTEAVVVALRERLARETGRARANPLREELAAIRRRCAVLPVVDNRPADEILGYDERGLPT